MGDFHNCYYKIYHLWCSPFRMNISPKSSFLRKPKCILFSFKASPHLIVTFLITLKKELHFRIFLLSWKKQWLSCSLHNLVVLWNWKIGVHQVIFICETLINQPYPEGAELCFRHHSTPRWSHFILGPISTVLIYCFCPPFSLKSLFTIFKKSFICFFLLLRTEHSVTSAGVLCLPNSCHVNLIYSFNSVLWEYFLFFFGMYYSTFWIFFLSLLKYCAQYHFHCGFLWGCSLRTFSLCPRIWMIAWLDRKFYLVISFSWLLWKFYSSTGCWKIWCQSDSSSLTDII